MSDVQSSADDTAGVGGILVRAWGWILVGANRYLLTGLVTGATFLLLLGLIRIELVAVGPGSNVASLFGSGFVSGILTLTTIALSINQLLLSRVFGTPDEYIKELEGAETIRERVRSRSDAHVTPNDPAAFLSLVAETLVEHAETLEDAVHATDWDAPAEVEGYVEGLVDYGEHIEANVSDRIPITDVLLTVLGSRYAFELAATERIRSTYEPHLTQGIESQLDAIYDLLEVLAISRQFFKTISLQQDFAQLSRVVAFTGVVGIVTSVVLTLVYREGGVAIDPQLLPLAVSLGVAIAVLPLAAFVSYVVRAATIARYTVSVGPFVPPDHFVDE